MTKFLLPNPKIRTILSGQPGVSLGILDIIPNASIAYSMRRLRLNYTGPCIRVRRSSDNSELDIGFDTSGNFNSADLSTFITNNSAYVVTWYDQSGNGRDITQGTSSNQPRIANAGTIDTANSIPAIYWDASKDELTNATAIDYSLVTIYTVVKHVGVASGQTIIGGPTGNNFQLRLNNGAGAANMSIVRAAATNVGVATAANTSNVLTQNTTIYRNTGGLSRFFLNGAANGTFTSGWTFGAQNNRIGNSIDFGGNESFNGWMQEIILYLADHSGTANQTTIEASEKGYFAIP